MGYTGTSDVVTSSWPMRMTSTWTSSSLERELPVLRTMTRPGCTVIAAASGGVDAVGGVGRVGGGGGGGGGGGVGGGGGCGGAAARGRRQPGHRDVRVP